jgi:cell division initiation protein
VTLDKIDLIDRKFSTSLLGYRREDVDSLVAEAAETIGRLAEEKMELARRVEDLRREVAGYQARESTLRDTLLTTQTIVEDVKAKAHREAECLLDEARDQATALVHEAEQQAARLGTQIDILQKRKMALASRFRDMLLATLDILDADQAEDGQEVPTPSCSLEGLAADADVEETHAGVPSGVCDATRALDQEEEKE